jgi:hypothetical protein
MTLYKIVRLFEEKELNTLNLEQLEESLPLATYQLKETQEEIEFYGETPQRSEDESTLRYIISDLEYLIKVKKES